MPYITISASRLLTREWSTGVDKRLWLGKSSQRNLAVGVDTGDGVATENETAVGSWPSRRMRKTTYSTFQK